MRPRGSGSSRAEKIALLADLQADWILTQLPLEAGEWLYAGCAGARIAAVPHALEPAVFQPRNGNAERDIDIGVRSARYTPYLGDNDRNRLLEHFANARFEPPLRVDVSTEQRLPREGWAAFLNRCRGTVATEAGSWYLQRDGGEYRFVEIDPASGEVDTEKTMSNAPGLASAGLALAPTRDEWALVRIGRDQTAGVVHLPQEQTVSVCPDDAGDDCRNLTVESVAITATRDYVGVAWAGDDGVRVRLFESGGNRVETVDDGDGPVRALGVAALPGDSNQVVVVWSDDSGVRSAAFSAGGRRGLRLDCEPADMLAVAASPSEVLVLSVHGDEVRLRRIDRASSQVSPPRVFESLGEIASPTLAWVGDYYAAAWVEDGRVRFFEAESGCAL